MRLVRFSDSMSAIFLPFNISSYGIMGYVDTGGIPYPILKSGSLPIDILTIGENCRMFSTSGHAVRGPAHMVWRVPHILGLDVFVPGTKLSDTTCRHVHLLGDLACIYKFLLFLGMYHTLGLSCHTITRIFCLPIWRHFGRCQTLLMFPMRCIRRRLPIVLSSCPHNTVILDRGWSYFSEYRL